MNKFFVIAFLIYSSTYFGQITSGPMLGHVTSFDAKVWLQTESPTQLTVQLSTKDQVPQESVVHTSAKDWNTSIIHLENLEPNTFYNYSINHNGTTISEGSFKTLGLLDTKNLPDFSFAFGSCTYINELKYDQEGEPFGRALGIIKSIESKNPNLMVWLGDNIYLRKGEWSSKTGIYRRYTQFKSRPELQSFWKSVSHYAIWDDHDFGPNDADRSFINKDITLQAFKDFWANPSYGINNKPGITTSFVYQDVEFFLLDNRYNRSPNHRETGEREILGKEQIEWLIDALMNSKANFKFVVVGGQVLSDAAVYENHATYPEERDFLLELMEKEKLKNIVFLSGDRHKTELSQLKIKSGVTLYDFTSSPLASKAFDSKDEGNNNQVEGTHVATQNFGTISVSGDKKNRTLLLKTFDASGTLLWERKISKQ